MTKPTKPQWADGSPSYVIEPSGAKKALGWLSGEKPPFQYANWLHYQTKQWIDWFENKISNVDTITLKSDGATWDGSSLVLNNDLLFYFRNEAGDLRINKIAAGTLSFSVNQALVVRFDRTNTSPVTLSLQATYSNLAAGEYGIFNLASLDLNKDDTEIVVMMRKDFTPTYHYGLDQQILFDLVSRNRYYQQSVFDFGSDKNKMLDGIFSQAALNANCEVSQLGNFTSAVNSSGGFSNNAFLIDGWKIGSATTNVYLSNATFQRTNVTITQEPHLKKAGKIVLNTSGSPISGHLFVGHICANNGELVENLEKFKGKIWTFEFWLRSNKANDVRVYLEDGVNTTYHQLDTGSGDSTWRRYSVSLSVSSSATAFRAWIGVCSNSGLSVTIANGDYIEYTGARIHIGTERLGVRMLGYMEDLAACRTRILGSLNGELMFNAGYGAYNLDSVAPATWRATNGIKYANLVNGVVSDFGTAGASYINLPEMTGTILRGAYIYDFGSTTRGGILGVSAKLSVTDSAGSTVDNVSVSGSAIYGSSMILTQVSSISQGIIEGYFFLISSIV